MVRKPFLYLQTLCYHPVLSGGGDKIARKTNSSGETLFQLSGKPILATNYYIELFILKVNKEFKNILYGMHVTKDKGTKRIYS